MDLIVLGCHDSWTLLYLDVMSQRPYYTVLGFLVLKYIRSAGYLVTILRLKRVYN